MNKLFVFDQKADREYGIQLRSAYEKVVEEHQLTQTQLEDLRIDLILEKKIEVVISNGLPKEWFYILKGLKIVTIVFDDISEFGTLADIVIDFKSDDNNKYFTGESYSLSNGNQVDLHEIVNLVEVLEWDSDFFGFRIGYLGCRYLTDSIYYQLMQYSKRHDLKLIEYLCNCHDDTSVKIAEKNGFHFTDIRLTFSINLRPTASYKPAEAEFRFQKAVLADIPALKSLTTDMYRDSRYYYDGNFTLDKINEFYSGWIEKAVLGTFDDECYCLFLQGRPVAFCTIKYRDGKSASIGLFGVSSDHTGKGLGKTLLGNVFDVLKEKVATITVVTQGRNYGAQRLYQSMGFKTESTQLWYHKWIE